MKYSFIITASLCSFLAFAGEKITIKAGKAVEVTYAEFATSDVKLNNSSGKQITVSVIDPDSKKKVQGFGLGPYGKVIMSIKKGHLLKLKNMSQKEVELSLSFIEKRKEEPKEIIAGTQRINFTMHNSSLKSIPLVIPSVMNPSLSPLSNSGVSLQIGQKVYYKKGLMKKLLFEVDNSIKQGDKVDIAKMIRRKEKES